MRGQRAATIGRAAAAEPHDADAAAARRRRDGDDGVGSGEHLRHACRHCGANCSTRLLASARCARSSRTRRRCSRSPRQAPRRPPGARGGARTGLSGPSLLIDAGLLHLLGEELRHLPQLDVLALPIRQARRRTRAGRRPSVAAERHVDDVLQRLERLAAMPHEQLGLLAGELSRGPSARLLDLDRASGCRAPR